MRASGRIGRGPGGTSPGEAAGASPARTEDGRLAARLAAHLRNGDLLRPGQAVVVGVSGGLDSTALLHLLRFGLKDWDLRLTVAHFDHDMRPGSAADARWVAGLCRGWRLPLALERAPVRPRGETDARSLRHAFLRTVLRESGADRLALAHHLDDQAETVLFRAIRGTGIAGLAGMRPRSGRLVRPLLPFRRREIAVYAASVRLRYREDPTNLEPVGARNRLRHEVMPRLEEVAPGAARALARLALRARAAEDVLRPIVSSAVQDVILTQDAAAIHLDRTRLRAYHPEVRARVLRRCLRRLGTVADAATTGRALRFSDAGRSGARIELPGGVRLGREFERLVFAGPPARGSGDDRALRIPGPEPGMGTLTLGERGWRFRWGPAEEGADRPEGDPNRLLLAVGGVRFPLEVRAWRPGDRIRLPYGSKKLKKLFAERRVPVSRRRSLPVLTDATGRVLWVMGVVPSPDTRPAPGEPAFEIRVLDVDRN